jgi:excisionase family DNA binding protein
MKRMIFEVPAMDDILIRLAQIEQKLDEATKPNPCKGIWLNTKEAAKALGISTRSLQEKRNRSEISFHQSGSTIRYRAEDIQQYLMDHFIKSRYEEGLQND